MKRSNPYALCLRLLSAAARAAAAAALFAATEGSGRGLKLDVCGCHVVSFR